MLDLTRSTAFQQQIKIQFSEFMIAAACFRYVVVNSQRQYGYPPTTTPTVDWPCSLPKKPGPCRGFCPRYYYDSNTDSCHEFTYGCCGGNANNFKTNALCENGCKQFRACPAIACLVPACTFETCPNFPEATCFAPCGCTSIWVYNGEDVTNRCHN
uniref:Chelonianin-like n=1 Tax=Crassostrea virginica TaxID=6565 RepID=A0A8B8C417_CRAVI|nr:chelonianin-like [Crassostrea virginica]